MSRCVDCNEDLPGTTGMIRCEDCWNTSWSAYQRNKKMRVNNRIRKKLEKKQDCEDLYESQ